METLFYCTYYLLCLAFARLVVWRIIHNLAEHNVGKR